MGYGARDMTLLTLALVLASAVVHATWNLWAKQIGPTARQAALMWDRSPEGWAMTP